MPIIKSAIKQMRKAVKNQKRNYATRRNLKAAIRSVIDSIKDKKATEAKKNLDIAYKVIDTATKKNIIHKNKANRNKSRLSKLVSALKTK